MAVSNLQLNVSANTARALADFKKFSRNLDNQFLVSGLKLDVIRNSLNQINRDFQRAIGEQGLASATSLRAAQNQAAMLTQVFKGFASESALAISKDLGTALNSVAVKAGGTMKDVQKTLAATPFISTRLSEDMREKLTTGIMEFTRDMRRSGLGDNFSDIMTQFLSGSSTGMDLIRQGGPIGTFLGSEIIKRVGGEGIVYDAKTRSDIAAQIVGNQDIKDQLKKLSVSTRGYLIILEDLNTNLFNTEKGVFGSLRKIIDKNGKPTTMFDEVYKLVDAVFGKSGAFVKFFNTIKEAFGVDDAMRPLIDAVQFLTKVFEGIGRVFESTGFRNVVKWAKDIFDRIVGVFRNVYDAVMGMSASNFSEESIIKGIRGIGESIRNYIKDIGQKIRGSDTEGGTGAIANIAGTLLTEVGKTYIVLIKELFATLIDKAPEIASAALPAVNRAINSLLEEAFGPLSKMVKVLLALQPGPLGTIARASLATDITGGQGNLGLAAAAAPFLLAGGGGNLFARGGRFLFGSGRLATAGRAIGLGMLGNQLGLDPSLSALFAFAPQLFSGARGGIGQLLGGNFLGAISSYGGSTINFLRRAGGITNRGIGNLIGGGRNLLSGVNPILQNFISAGQGLPGRLNTLGVFLNSQKSQFMAGFRPPFPNVAIGAGTTRAYQAGQFLRNIPGNTMAMLGNVSSNLTGFGNSLLTSARSATSAIATASRNMVSGLINLGVSTYQGSVSAARSFARSSMVNQFRAGMNPPFPNVAVGAPTTGAYRAGAAFSRFGGLALAGGLLVAGSQLLGGSIGGRTGKEVSGVGTVLGSGLSGAATGAMIGSIVPGIGTAAGAIIGGIIGGIAPLMDKGVREGVQSFISRIGKFFVWIGESIGNAFRAAGDWMKNALKSAMNGFIGVMNGALTAMNAIPRLIVGVVSSLYNRLPDNVKPQWATNAINGINSAVNFQIPSINYGGKDFYGPSLSLESRMSGRRAMVVNEGEFVIPNNGFSTLSGLVSDNLLRTGAIPSQSSPVIMNLSLNLTVNSLQGTDPQQLAKELKEPVYKIINDAWREANTTMIRRARIN